MRLARTLAANGFALSLKETARFSQDEEFNFSVLVVRLLRGIESEGGSKYKTEGVCDGIARVASKVLGGKRDKIEQQLSTIVAMLEYAPQSDIIGFYSWMFDKNLPYSFVTIHNKILERMKTLDSDLLLSKARGMNRVSHVFKDAVDIVGKYIGPQALEVFVANVEAGDKSRGGLRDRKVTVMLSLSCAITAAYEIVSREKEDPYRSEVASKKHANTEYSAEKPKKIDYIDKEVRRYAIDPSRQYQSNTQQRPSDFDLNEIHDNYSKNPIEVERKNSPEKRASSRQTERKVAHRYFFGETDTLEGAKAEVRKIEKPSNKDHLEMLRKKLADSEKRNSDLDDLYDLCLNLFGKAKKNYTTLGREIGHCRDLAGFLKKFYPNEKECVKVCKEVQTADIPDARRVKLTIGKVLEKASKNMYLEHAPLFKFGLDQPDYDDQQFEGEYKGNKDVMYDLLVKDPEDTTKGVKNVKNSIREHRQLQSTAQLDKPDETEEYYTEPKVKLHGTDELHLLQKSVYYPHSESHKRSLMRNRGAIDSADAEVGPMIEERLLFGMGALVIRKHLAPEIAQSSGVRNLSSLSKRDYSKEDREMKQIQQAGESLKAKARLGIVDFEKGLGPNYVEFDDNQFQVEESSRRRSGKKPVFDGERSKENHRALHESKKIITFEEERSPSPQNYSDEEENYGSRGPDIYSSPVATVPRTAKKRSTTKSKGKSKSKTKKSSTKDRGTSREGIRLPSAKKVSSTSSGAGTQRRVGNYPIKK